MEKFKMLHITHNDSDALGCALVAHYKYCNEYDIVTKFCAIGTQNKIVLNELEKMKNGEIIYNYFIISDISLSEETSKILDDFINEWNADETKENKIMIAGYDHHMSNNLDTIYDYWDVIKTPVWNDVYDDNLNISTCQLMWNELLEDEVDKSFIVKTNRLLLVKEIVDRISRYDTWEWKKHPSEDMDEDTVQLLCLYFDINNLLKQFIIYYDHISELAYTEGLNIYRLSPVPGEHRAFYEAIQEKEKQKVKSIPYKVRILENWGKGDFPECDKIAIFIGDGYFNSFIQDEIYEKYNPDILVAIFAGESEISFRTRRKDINLSAWCKERNGGGHPEAAGIKLGNEGMLKYLAYFYSAKSIFELEEENKE